MKILKCPPWSSQVSRDFSTTQKTASLWDVLGFERVRRDWFPIECHGICNTTSCCSERINIANKQHPVSLMSWMWAPFRFGKKNTRPQKSPNLIRKHVWNVMTPSAKETLVDPIWWLNQPVWKICASQIGSFPPFSGWKPKKSLSCHHLEPDFVECLISDKLVECGLDFCLPINPWGLQPQSNS